LNFGSAHRRLARRWRLLLLKRRRANHPTATPSANIAPVQAKNTIRSVTCHRSRLGAPRTTRLLSSRTFAIRSGSFAPVPAPPQTYLRQEKASAGSPPASPVIRHCQVQRFQPPMPSSDRGRSAWRFECYRVLLPSSTSKSTVEYSQWLLNLPGARFPFLSFTWKF
jgi:hypothetical protein